MSTWLGVWLGAIVTFAVFSYLAKDNIAYRLVQQAALGVSVGVGVVVAWQQVLKPNWWSHIAAAWEGTEPPAAWLWLLALVPGSLWYFQLSKRWFRLSTLVTGLFIGVAAGLAFKNQILLILPQIAGSLRPLNPFAGPGGFTGEKLFGCLSNLVFLVALLTTLMYFFFSLKTDSPLIRLPMRVGRVMIMLALGAMFGSTVMTRMAYLIERLQFLYDRWLMSFLPGP
jgi:hypothetical protein